MALLEESLLTSVLGKERKSMILSKGDKRRNALHESGHALVAMFTVGSNPIRRATIIPRGESLGKLNQLQVDEFSSTKQNMLASIKTHLGGRAAEEIIYGEEGVSAEAQDDFAKATKIAALMINDLGFSEKIGHVWVNEEYTSKSTIEIANGEITRIVESCYQEVQGLLKSKEKELKVLADALEKYETLDKEEIEKVLKGERLIERDKRDVQSKVHMLHTRKGTGIKETVDTKS